MDEKWEPYWHVFLGKSFGCHSVHERNRFVYFTFEPSKISFLIYKASWRAVFLTKEPRAQYLSPNAHLKGWSLKNIHSLYVQKQGSGFDTDGSHYTYKLVWFLSLQPQTPTSLIELKVISDHSNGGISHPARAFRKMWRKGTIEPLIFYVLAEVNVFNHSSKWEYAVRFAHPLTHYHLEVGHK